MTLTILFVICTIGIICCIVDLVASAMILLRHVLSLLLNRNKLATPLDTKED